MVASGHRRLQNLRPHSIVLPEPARIRAPAARVNPASVEFRQHVRLVHVVQAAFPRGLRSALPVRVHRLLALRGRLRIPSRPIGCSHRTRRQPTAQHHGDGAGHGSGDQRRTGSRAKRAHVNARRRRAHQELRVPARRGQPHRRTVRLAEQEQGSRGGHAHQGVGELLGRLPGPVLQDRQLD